MSRGSQGSSANEAESYLASVFSTCTGFEMAVVTSVEASSRRRLRERLIAEGAQIASMPPRLEQVLEARRAGAEPSGHRPSVLWIEAEADSDADDEDWRELAAALNRIRDRLRQEHRYLWVLAGPLSLRRIMTRQAQDLYSGAYKVPHVIGHEGAELRWLHLSDLQLGGEEVGRGARQGGDVWQSVEQLLLPDLARMLDDAGAGVDLVIVSGDLAASGQTAEYDQVDRFLDRVLDGLERGRGRRPLLLTVPGNHDVMRPADPVERWRFEVLRRHDDERDEYALSLREHLWARQDAGLIRELFANYAQWAQRRLFESQPTDELGMEPGVVYVRSVVRSHVAGDLSVVVEKDDFRVGLVGLNTAWTSLDDDVKPRGVTLPFEQFAATLGTEDPWRWADEVDRRLLITHHGPEWLSEASTRALTRRIQPVARFDVHLCGPAQGGDEPSAGEPDGLALQRGYPVQAWGIAQRGRPSGYRLGRIGRDGRIESSIRVLEPIRARGAWRFVNGVEYEPPVGATPKEQEPEWWLQELRHYLDKIEALHGELRLAGFETKVRVPLALDELYVPLDAIVDQGTGRRHVFQSSEDADVHDAEVELARAFEVARRMGRRGVVLLGDPGSGKTTHLRQVLLKVVRNGPESIGLPKGTVPVFLPLRRLHDLEAGLPGFIVQELRDPLLDVDEGFGLRLCKRGKLLFLLDGLDEVANADDRRRVARWIEAARRAGPENYFLVSSRFSGYTLDAQLDEGFLELHLRPMSNAQAESFVRKWYELVERATTDDPEQAMITARKGATDLLATLRKQEMSSSRIYAMTHNPLMLTTICLVHRDRGTLPHEHVVLYEEAVSVLLERWRSVSKGLDVTFPAREALWVLMPVAKWMHEGGRIRASVDELQAPVTEGLASIGREDVSAQTFLETIRDESGLLTGWGVDEFGFMHLGFQEYLTALAIQSQSFDHPEVLERLAEHFDQSWWQEVILLLLAQDRPAVFKRFMGELVQRPQFPQWARSELMELCWDEAFGVSAEPFVELLREQSGDATLGARQLAAAELLARRMPAALEGLEELMREHPSGEVQRWWQSRARVAGNLVTKVVHGVELVLVPGGRFLMGSPDDEDGRLPGEGPRHHVELESFWVARTPVTNAQYREYMKANPGVREPRFWGDRRYNQDMQPVVGISWHEAMAYCHWAGLQLPTEAQWEYACRAGTTTRFCSGDGEEDLARVAWYERNSDERLHEVGELEPNAWGLYDMHGNARQWCEDAFGRYTTSPRTGDGLRHEPVGDAYRVLRGGDFGSNARNVRSASRARWHPNGQLVGTGFRPAQGHSS